VIDSQYINQLLVTFHYFTKPKTLLDLLLSAISEPEPVGADELELKKHELRRERYVAIGQSINDWFGWLVD
jgi:hypothetical protein